MPRKSSTALGAGELLDAWGRSNNRKYPDRQCEQCGSTFKPCRDSHRFCSRRCAYDARRGSPAWNAGTSEGWIGSRGYRWVWASTPDGRKKRREHRVVMEEHLGRPLRQDEDVHHINGDKTDNRVANLQIISHGAHSVKTNSERDYESGYTLDLPDEEREARSQRAKEMELWKMGHRAQGLGT